MKNIKFLFNRAVFVLVFLPIIIYSGNEKYQATARSLTGFPVPLNTSTKLLVRDAQYSSYLNTLLSNPGAIWPGSGNAGSSGTFFDRNLKNRVVFSIDHSNNKYVSNSYNVTITFNVTVKKYVSGSFVSTTTNGLQLTVSSNQTFVDVDKAVYDVPGAGQEILVQVTNISSSVSLPDLRIQLDGEVEIERYYYFNPGAQYPTSDLTHCSVNMNSSGELDVVWKAMEGAEEYELEWIHVNNYDGTTSGVGTYNLMGASAISLNQKTFDFNSTRITTGNTYYKIPYIYERGYILYRLRALGRKLISNWDYNIPCVWSVDMNGATPPANVGAFPNFFPNNTLNYPGCNTSMSETFVGLNELINWQSSISYAEEGKSRTVVNYSDGSLRNRQSVTKLKSSSDIIIGETIYDFQGRPAISVLPAPASISKIGYTSSFNQIGSNNPLDADDFDYDALTGNCVVTSQPLVNISGASNYYSSANPITTNENKFIPDASGFPFTQTEYMPDNTGRVRNQSGVGPVFQLGTDRETKYFYGIPQQKELDRLFGPEVGYKKLYKKNMVVDANSQTSISYLDPNGKVIATSLAGPAPANLAGLPSTSSLITTFDLLDKNLSTDNSGVNNKIDLVKGEVSLQESILAPANSPYTFTYSLQPPKYVENCGRVYNVPENGVVTTTGTKCYNCVLDAKLSLLDQCGKELFSTSFQSSPPRNYATMGTLDSSCGGASQNITTIIFTPNDASNPVSSAWLKTGSYVLEKTFKVNQAALDLYTRNYLDTAQNSCILKLSDFKNAQVLDITGCGIDCSTCLAQLGPYSNYSGSSCTLCLTQEEYDDLKAECDELCTPNSSKCETALSFLLADMSPSGQYAQYNSTNNANSNPGNVITPPQPNTVQTGLFPLSVLNENNDLPIRNNIKADFNSNNMGYNQASYFWPTWRHPYNPGKPTNLRFSYLDDNGQKVMLKLLPNGTNYIPAVAPAGLSFVQIINGVAYVEPRYLNDVADFINLWEEEWANSLVAYHPEYFYYEKCIEDAASNDFDAAYTELDTIPDIVAYMTGINGSYVNDEYMYPVGKPNSLGVFNSTIIDPYFKSAGNGFTLLSAIQNSMVNYKQDPNNPSSYISIWDMVYRIINCPNGNSTSFCPSSAIPSNYIFSTTQEWNTFKGLYQSLKQSFQDRVNTEASINNFAYNACIGASPFDPFENKFYDPNAFTITYPANYFSSWSGSPFFFNFWQPISSSNVSQYYNFAQTCNYNRASLYENKIARFPTAKMLMPSTLSQASSPCYDDQNNAIPCPESDVDVVETMGNETDMALYQNCGQCPTAVNFQALLKALSTLSTTVGQQDLSNSSNPGVKLTCAPNGTKHNEFTIELAESMFGSGAPVNNIYWSRDNTVLAPLLKGKFSQVSGPDCDLYIQMPTDIVPTYTMPSSPNSFPSFSNPYDYSDIVDVCCLKYSPTPLVFQNTLYTGPGRFTATITVLTKSPDPWFISSTTPTYRQLTIEGYLSCLDFKNCSFNNICKPSKEIRRIQNLVNALFYKLPAAPTAGAYSSSAVGLNVLPYSGIMQTQLINDLDAVVETSNNNMSDNWYWQKTTPANNKQFTGYFTPTTNGNSGKCYLTLNLLPTSAFSNADIKKITGLKPSDLPGALPGDFTGYALLRNASVNGGVAKYEKITGNISCLNAGECAQKVSSQSQVGGGQNSSNYSSNTNGGPLSSGCTLQGAAVGFESYFKAGINWTCGTCSPNQFVGTYASCSYTLSLPSAGNFAFNNIVSVMAIYPNPYYAGSNHFFLQAVINMPNITPVQTATVLIEGYSPCINVISNCPPPPCEGFGNIVVNGDFEQGNLAFLSDYNYTPNNTLSYANLAFFPSFPAMATSYVPPVSWGIYNVYSLKTYLAGKTDHTQYMQYNPIPNSLPWQSGGYGNALVTRAENRILDFTNNIFPGEVWKQYVNLVPNTTYTFSAYFKANDPAYENFNALVCEFYLNNQLIKQEVAALMSTTINDWFNITRAFNAGAVGTNSKLSLKVYFGQTVNNVLQNVTPFPGGIGGPGDHDVFIDDISVVGCIAGEGGSDDSDGDGVPDNASNGVYPGNGSGSFACNIPPNYEIEMEDDCAEDAQNNALEAAEYNYNFYMDTLRKNFQARYIKKCLDAYEDLFMKTYDSEHHYTLYYYDQAGNLVKTIPPQGVNRLADQPSILAQVKSDRLNNVQTVFTNHAYASTYKYNSLNQLVNQTIPDHNEMNIWQSKNYTGVPSNQNVQGMAFNGNKGVLLSNNGSSGFMYSYNSQTGSWTPITGISINNLNDVAYIGSAIYVVGKNGTVLKSTNNGTNWSVLAFPNLSVELIKVHKMNTTDVVMYDKDGNRWISTNGGVSWTQTSNLFGFALNEKLLDLKYNSSNNSGFAVSDQKKIYQCTSGNWALTSNNFKQAGLRKVIGTGSNVVYCLGKDGTILKSTNNGASFTELASSLTTDIVNAEFYTNDDGFVLDANGDIFSTVGSAAIFQQITAPGNQNYVSMKYLSSVGNLFALNSNGTIDYYTSTTSQLWNGSLPAPSIASPNPSVLYHSLNAISTLNMFVGGDNGKLFNYNGSTWTQLNVSPVVIPNTENIVKLDLKLYGASVKGYILTNNGSIYYYNDAQSPFITQVITGSYTDVFSTSPNSALAVNNTGSLLQITNGAANTSASLINASANFKSVFINSGSNLVAVGENISDQFAEITSGSFPPFNSPVLTNISLSTRPPAIRGVGIDGSNSYICGDDGTILKYNGTTQNWENKVTADNTSLNTISVSGGNVIAAGSNFNTGKILYSSNGGSTSFLSTTNGVNDFYNSMIVGGNVYFVGKNRSVSKAGLTPTSLTSISAGSGSDKFFGVASDGTNVTVVGENGLVYGGNTSATTFNIQSNVNPPILNDVKWFDNTHVIAVGNSGAILVSDNAGLTWNTLATSSANNYKAVDILNPNTAIVVGTNQEYFSVSLNCLGLSCSYVINTISKPGTGTSNFNDVSCANGDIAVVDASGVVYYKAATMAGFISASPTGQALNSVHLLSNTFGYCVGNTGTAYKIIPSISALSFVQGSTPNTQNLKSVYFKDYTNGYAGGNNGTFIITTNGGATWLSQTGPTSIGSNNINVITPQGSSVAIGANAGASGNLIDNSSKITDRFYYDKLGRLVASQNSRQFAGLATRYSYTKYDALGRINEVGEVDAATSVESIASPINAQVDPAGFTTWLNTNLPTLSRQITKTYYDAAATLPVTYDGAGTFSQDNLRNRVSYSTYQEAPGSSYDNATYYSYDIHGNVKSLYRYNSVLPAGNKYKRTDYNYDLVSGSVNSVVYQGAAADQLHHKYEYDDDNRLISVISSKDGVIFDRDAKYFYYRHGPLARVELGHNKVQGTDYAYTLQGWIKGVNSDKLVARNDQGQDAFAMATNSINDFVSGDALGYHLGYYNNDYSNIVAINPQGYFLADQTGSPLNAATVNLYNGNISQAGYSIKKFIDLNGTSEYRSAAYQYDQLNRLVATANFNNFNLSGNQYITPTTPGQFNEDFSYDANGNILSLQRNNSAGSQIDNLTYSYNNIAAGYTKNTNQLSRVQDGVSGSTVGDIPSGQIANNYSYDNLGNLVGDNQEDILNVDWNVYGKIKSITRTALSTKPDLEFTYDAEGNRLSKIEKTKTAGGILQASNLWNYTYYSRDVNGSILALYEKTAGNSNTLYLREYNLYGSQRLGSLTRNINMQSPPTAGPVYQREAGNKMFELSNHLGNVLTTVSDRKLSVDDGVYNASGVQTSFVPNGLVDYYKPDITSASDYYAFGAPMPGKQFNSGNYRYGFNGKENDNELKGTGNSLDFEARIYDSRLGRWMSVDPLHAKYAEKSPFMFASDNPTNRVDIDGEDDFHFYFVTTKVLIPQPGGGVKTVMHQTSFYTVEKNDKKNTYTVHNLTKQAEGGKFGPWKEYTKLVEGSKAGKMLLNFNVDEDYPVEIGSPDSRRSQDKEVFALQQGARNVMAKEKEKEEVGQMMGLVASFVVPELLASFAGEAAAVEMTTVGRWMSQTEYDAMVTSGRMLEGGGGQTFVSTNGFADYMGQATKGSVYAEFQVPTSSLLKGGKDGWFKAIGPNSSKSMQQALSKQGGEMLPKVENLSPVLKTK